MKVTRCNREFDVRNDPQTRSWGFWDKFANGTWEPATFDMLDAHADPDRDFVDIGAWVGPLTLWASDLYRSVIAVEPDPTAWAILRANTNPYANVHTYNAAASTDFGTAKLYTGGTWGDSMSTLHPNGNRHALVDTKPLSSILWETDPALVKIDTEGGEATLLPAYTDLLHDLACPIVLGLHWPWIDDPEPVRKALDTFTVDTLDDHRDFPTVVLT